MARPTPRCASSFSPTRASRTEDANVVRNQAVLTISSAYYELVTDGASGDEATELSIAAALLLDAERLPALCLAVRDPFAWQPFLLRLHRIPAQRRTPRSAAALHRLSALATDLLHAQGLGLVRPEDLLARPTPFEEAFASLATNTI